MTNDRKNIFTGHLLAIITVLIWGNTFISTKVLLNAFSPVEILFIRFGIALLVLLIVYPKRLKTSGIKEELLFAVAGLCGVTLYFLLQNISLTYTTASNVSIITATAPLFTAIFSRLLLKSEKLSRYFLIGFALSIAGIFLISFNGSALKLNPLGDILAILASVFWAIYSILTKKISEFGYHIIQTTRRIFLYGLLFLLPTLFFFETSWTFQKLANPSNLFNILFLGIGASAICFITWNLSVERIGPIKTSTYIYLVPVITVTASMLILKEKMNAVSGFGILLIIIGLCVSEFRSKNHSDL